MWVRLAVVSDLSPGGEGRERALLVLLMYYDQNSDANAYERERDETPMARMAREQLESEQKADKVIRALHASLPAHSSHIQLFTFTECREWGLRKNARRSVGPANNDHEQDGA